MTLSDILHPYVHFMISSLAYCVYLCVSVCVLVSIFNFVCRVFCGYQYYFFLLAHFIIIIIIIRPS